MEENKDEKDLFKVPIYGLKITPTEQPSTPEVQANEANSSENSSQKNEIKSEASRSVRRRRMKKERLAQEQNSDTSKVAENSTEMPKKPKAKKKVRRNARRRQKNAGVNKKPEVGVGEQNQATYVEYIPIIRNLNENKKISFSIPTIAGIPIPNLPASEILKKIFKKTKNHFFRRPDYENCDYYAYDYDTVEECAEELGPDETIEVTIDCTEFIPMFTEFVPMRHYFENTRVARLVQRCLLDIENPSLPVPIELIPDVLTGKENSNENETDTDDIATSTKQEPEESKNKTNQEDEIWFSWMDPLFVNDIKQEIITDENVAVANEIVENPRNILIKYEIEDDDTTNKDIFKNMAVRIFQAESDIKMLQHNMNDFKESMDELKQLLEMEERIPQKESPTQENISVESQTDTVNDNNEVQTGEPSRNQEKVNDTTMKMSDCSKNENVIIPLCDEEIKTKQFAACTKDAPKKPKTRKIRKASEILSLSIPHLELTNAAEDSKMKNIEPQPKLDEEQDKHDNKTKTRQDNTCFDKDAVQGTSTEKQTEFKINFGETTLIASNRNEAEVEACVKKILKQLKERVNTKSEIVIAEQPHQQIQENQTVQEMNDLISKRRATETKKIDEKKNKFSDDPKKIDYRDVVAGHKQDIEEKLNLHEFCTCKVLKIDAANPHLCIKGHRLCFSKNTHVTNEEVALAAAEWSYLLKLGNKDDAAFYRELLAKNTIEDAVVFLRHVQEHFIANAVTVSSIPALRIESDREYEVEGESESSPPSTSPPTKKGANIRKRNKRK